MFKLLLAVAVVLFATFSTVNSDDEDLFPYIKEQCHAHRTDLTSCIFANVNHMIKYLEIEVPDDDDEGDTFSLQPVKVGDISISLKDKGYNYTINLSTIYIYDASNFVMKNLTYLDTFSAELETPRLNIISKFRSTLELDTFPSQINSTGLFNATWLGVTADVTGKVTKYQDAEKEYIQLEDIRGRLAVQDIRIIRNEKIVKNVKIDTDEIMNSLFREQKGRILQSMLDQLTGRFFEEVTKNINLVLNDTPLKNFYNEDLDD